MPVYAIQAGDSRGPVKIGHGNPHARRNGLQIGNHLELRIIRVFLGGRKEERALQRRFAQLEIRGEWFSFSREMLGDVGLVEIPVSSVIPLPKPNVINPLTGKVGREWTADERAAAGARQLAISADPVRRAARQAKFQATAARKAAEKEKMKAAA